jgi:hypothetical protein
MTRRSCCRKDPGAKDPRAYRDHLTDLRAILGTGNAGPFGFEMEELPHPEDKDLSF